ncbi:MAG: type II secretion system F family protein [Candidatus Omnitrophota bacterium]
MLSVALILIMTACFSIIMFLTYDYRHPRPTLKSHELGLGGKKPDQRLLPSMLRALSAVNKPFITPAIRRNMSRGLGLSHMGLSPEEFLLFKEIVILILFWFVLNFLDRELRVAGLLIAIAVGWFMVDVWLRMKIKKVKAEIIKLLPDTVDLLGLCVNAGLDFMMALKWVIEKSAPSVLIAEMNNVLQEVNMGKPRRDALRDLARRYELPELSTFSRTLIQADKMGTSVSEALNILSEDMRMSRYRRGEAMALKAPLKMLVPLLFCIFPVVGILVGAPIFLDFMYNNPLKSLGAPG